MEIHIEDYNFSKVPSNRISSNATCSQECQPNFQSSHFQWMLHCFRKKYMEKTLANMYGDSLNTTIGSIIYKSSKILTTKKLFLSHAFFNYDILVYSCSLSLLSVNWSKEFLLTVISETFRYQKIYTKRDPWVVLYSHCPINNSCGICIFAAYLAIML